MKHHFSENAWRKQHIPKVIATRNTSLVNKNHTLVERPRQEGATSKSYVIRPVHRQQNSQPVNQPLEHPSDPVKSMLPSLPSLTSSEPTSTKNEDAATRNMFNINPKPYAGSNMVSAMNNLLTQRLTNAQKFGPAVIGKS